MFLNWSIIVIVMVKSTTWSEDFDSMITSLSKKKNESVKDLEDLKRKVVLNINVRIDSLYVKKDYIFEVLANKTELKKLKLGVWTKFIRTNLWTSIKYLFSMPFIYGMIIPGLFIHFFLEIYHQVGFRIYKIPLVKSKKYFIFDRKFLPYLNWLERFNCFYCSYYTGLMSYMQEIIGRTERYWCPIKHSQRMNNPHAHYSLFMDYSQSKNMRKDWETLREFKKVN